MIKVENMSRRYGAVTAVDCVSFEIGSGEVVGFLGPNGAGKTTTLRVLTGCLLPSGGKVSIAGLDVETRALECRRLTGYLPENNPLYDDMETVDYLLWCGKMRGLSGGELKDAVRGAIGRCGLSPAAGRDLGQLSKGYRQRAGLAAAILHNPPVIFLDEPTSGLDPNQAQEVRSLINELKKEKTIMLSTHILPEAQSVCDRLLIINRGKIVANGKTGELVSGGEQKVVVTFASGADAESIRRELSALEGVLNCAQSGEGGESVFTLSVAPDADLRGKISALAAKNGWPLLGLELKKVSLEEVFRSLTL